MDKQNVGSGALADKIRILVEGSFEKNFKEQDKFFPYFLALEIALFPAIFTILSTLSADSYRGIIVLLFTAVFCVSLSFFFRIWYILRRDKRYEVFKQRHKEVLNKCTDYYDSVLEIFKEKAILQVKLEVLEQKKVVRPEEIEKMAKGVVEKTMSSMRNEVEGHSFFEMLSRFVIYEVIEQGEMAFEKPLEESFPRVKLLIDRLSEKVKNKLLFISVVLLIGAAFIRFL